MVSTLCNEIKVETDCRFGVGPAFCERMSAARSRQSMAGQQPAPATTAPSDGRRGLGHAQRRLPSGERGSGLSGDPPLCKWSVEDGFGFERSTNPGADAGRWFPREETSEPGCSRPADRVCYGTPFTCKPMATLSSIFQSFPSNVGTSFVSTGSSVAPV